MAMKGRVKIVRVEAPDALGEVLREVVLEKYDGNLSQAARDARVARPTFYNLANGTYRGSHMGVLGRVRRIVPVNRRARFDDANLGLVARRALDRHDRWLDGQFENTAVRNDVGRKPPRITLRRWITRRFMYHLRTREQRLQRVVVEMRIRFPELIAEFERRLYDSQHFNRRGQLALMRVVAPLIEPEDSGYVERSWREMTVDELRAFLKAGMKRELILLNRSPDVQRAQEIAKDDVLAIRELRSTG